MKDLLTEREFQIIELICNGKSDKMIADELFISINTLKFHKTSIYKKLRSKQQNRSIAGTNKTWFN